MTEAIPERIYVLRRCGEGGFRFAIPGGMEGVESKVQ